MGQLTAKQIENWRKVLYNQIGAYALIVPASDIQKIANNVQYEIDREEAFISKTLAGQTDTEVVHKPAQSRDATFGDLIREAKQSKNKVSSS